MALSPTSSGPSSAGAGVGALFFDTTLGADTATIDTGAAGIPQTQSILEVWVIARTDDATGIGAVSITLNNDTGANYDQQFVRGTVAAASASATVGNTAWNAIGHGSGGRAAVAGVTRLTIPGYRGTTFEKVGELCTTSADSTAANSDYRALGVSWRNTAAITRLAVSAGAGSTVLRAGSRLLIYGK